jgi:hypothetical protein
MSASADPFASVRAEALFPGQPLLLVEEVAQALRCTERHIINLLTEGTHLRGLNIALGERQSWRIPATAFDAFITLASQTR